MVPRRSRVRTHARLAQLRLDAHRVRLLAVRVPAPAEPAVPPHRARERLRARALKVAPRARRLLAVQPRELAPHALYRRAQGREAGRREALAGKFAVVQ